ncbi:MAG TPA: SMP-30/gluconolactonase/LRE family protein [Acidimicrobiales bacterium]|nr:SMP-30/gluconolactonase/LRE family protein [Acidimicrobiales bacterium]
MENYDARVITEGLAFGEGPRWHEGRLWFSDFYRHRVSSIKPDGSDERVELVLDTQPSGLGWLPDGDLVVASQLDRSLVRVRNGVTSTLRDLSPHFGFWANDLVTSARGVTYVGNFGFDLDLVLRDEGVEGLSVERALTNVVVVGADGDVLQVVPDFVFPNGSVITPDETTIIIAETLAFRLSAFDIAPDGTLSNRRVWAQLDFVAIDGICLDAEGQIWVANALGTQCLRVKEGGEITASASASQNTYACMLGGDARDELFIMTAPTSSRFDVADVRVGKIEVAKVAVPGAGRP